MEIFNKNTKYGMQIWIKVQYMVELKKTKIAERKDIRNECK